MGRSTATNASAHHARAKGVNVRRRTKPRVVWLPNTNANSVSNAGVFRTTWQTFVIQVTSPNQGSIAVGEIPIVIDSQDDPLAAATSLSDVENSGYRLRRIVGKIFCFAKQDVDVGAGVCGVTAGLIVRRSDPSTGISFALATGDETLIDPSDISNSGDPWIWRRNWILFNLQNRTDLDAGPTSNIEYGSVADGPHVDAKTARIISSEERLFLNLSVTNLRSIGGVAVGSEVRVFTDLRVLASMRTSSGNRRNASR